MPETQPTLFRAEVDRHGWKDHVVFLRHFRKSAEEVATLDGLPHLATLEPAAATFEAWYYTARKPQKDFQRVLTHMFGHSIDQLWGPAAQAPPGAAPGTPHTDVPAYLGTDLREMRKVGAMAARRAMQFTLGAENNQVGEETLGFLRDEVTRIAQEYPRVPLPELWEDLAQAQDDAFRLIEGGRARPTQARELLRMAAILSFMMAKGSHDMGDPATARMQARTAGFCAREAEEPALVALVDGLKSLIAYWAGQPEDALHFARQGSAAGHQGGSVSVWLPGLEARAAAVLGDAEAVQEATVRAERLREAISPDALDELGGLLTYSLPKQRYYHVEAAVLLGQGDDRLGRLAEEAVKGLSDKDDPNWAFGDLAGSQCNLALVRLNGGDLEGAADAVRPVLDLPPSYRNAGIVTSVHRVRGALSTGPLREAATGRQLHEEIGLYKPNRPALPR
ncbi:hypothetical protein ACWEDZ_09255 [Streptomyces sp. NPDC005047]|uniref:Tetratricopeptide repeat protein n=1 Tax=Streptomyces parvulus TaxID=146923 RepID=A0ABV5D9T6_9ACTN